MYTRSAPDYVEFNSVNFCKGNFQQIVALKKQNKNKKTNQYKVIASSGKMKEENRAYWQTCVNRIGFLDDYH